MSRVIFLPPDYFRDPPKENLVTNHPAFAGDMRRAGAFIKHRIANDDQGVNAILQEAIEAQRVRYFIEATLVTLDAVVAELLTAPGLRGLDEWIAFYAERQWDRVPTEWHRAARLIIARGRGELDQLNEILGETENVSPTVIAAVDVYRSVIPLMSTHIGDAVLEGGIRRLAGLEAEGDQ
ncbi:MAG: hypothetical protein QG597_2933 [Actinomycetota bacterium]|nr:hypothetical protein [Actinomycetota bacterium]